MDTVLAPAKRGVAVTFRIVEGEPTRVGTLTVTQRAPVLSTFEMERAIALREGEPLSLIALDSTLARLKAAPHLVEDAPRLSHSPDVAARHERPLLVEDDACVAPGGAANGIAYLVGQPAGNALEIGELVGFLRDLPPRLVELLPHDEDDER